VLKRLDIPVKTLVDLRVVKRSVRRRKREAIQIKLSLDLELRDPDRILKRFRPRPPSSRPSPDTDLPVRGPWPRRKTAQRPAAIRESGLGPAG